MHARAEALKQQIEATLANRIPAALSPLPQQSARLLPTGNRPVDILLDGGLPLGSVCELAGPEGSGHTSLALSVLAAASAESACAFVDVSDSLSPRCAAAAGVRLGNLLWVRLTGTVATPSGSTNGSAGESRDPAGRSGPAVGRASGPAAPLAHSSPPTEQTGRRPIHGGCGSSHPRGETRDLAPALEQMLFHKAERRHRKLEGTPGHPNQPLGLHTASKEQVDWERFNLRRVDESDPLRQMDQLAAVEARKRAATTAVVASPQQVDAPLDRLGRALRATDQILQSGGFRIVVLDLASIAPHAALRIPSATWFRFRRAAQESDAILLLLTPEPCARSSAACVLELQPGAQPRVQGVLQAAERSVQIARQRTAPAWGKKAPGRATSWSAVPAFQRAAGR